jgi:S-adenosylmethionine synthetase
MNQFKRLITSESVGYGHPDKMADQISDSILDLYLTKDPNSRVAVETMVKDNMVILGGETKTSNPPTKEEIINRIKELYSDFNFPSNHNLSPDNIIIHNYIGEQSTEINQAVDYDDGEIGSGDQGFMTGFASNETPNYMPLGMYLAKNIIDYVTTQTGLGPDAKSQVTIEETPQGSKVHTVLVSTMHTSDININDIEKNIIDTIKTNKLGFPQHIMDMFTEETKFHINPAGSWNIGGPVSDCGVTGRKIIVDQYGAYCGVGGGAFSGKDSSKVDRSASYLCRYIAKNIVAAGHAEKCKVEIAYMIGVAEPISINIEGYIYGNNNVRVDYPDYFYDKIREIFPMTPKQITEHFSLKEPIFYETARFGHYGIDNRPWEKLDKIEELKKIKIF